MSTSSKNLLVGLFVLVALAMLGWLVVKFGARPRAFSDTYAVTMTFPAVGSLATGSEVRVKGLVVGRVRDLAPIQQFIGGVRVVADIESRHAIPADAIAVINLGGLTLSKAGIDIEVARDASPRMLPRNGKAELEGVVRSNELIPQDVREQIVTLSKSLTVLSEDLHVLFRPQPLEPDGPATTGPDGTRVAATQPSGNLSTVVQRMDLTVRRINELLDARNGDMAKFIENLRLASDNAREVTETLKTFAQKAVVVTDDAGKTFQTATAQLKRIGDSLVDNSVKMSAGLDTLNKALAQIADGKGTAGKLLNDPALYENLLLSSDRLHKTIIELQELVKQWQATGVRIKLN